MQKRVYAVCSVAMAAVLLALSAWIAIPTVPPFTMQTAAVFLVAALLGRRKGAAAVCLYLLLGLLGLPVFAGFTGGMAVILGPTGGYLLGFLPMVLFSGSSSPSPWKRMGWWMLGLLSCYVVGTLWYAGVYLTFSAESLLSAATVCVVPYILPDIAKMAAAWWVARRIERPLQSYL